MLLRGTSFAEYNGDFLSLDFDYVSPAVGSASITHSQSSGRDGRGGLTFAVGGAGTFAYDMYAQFNYDAAGTIVAGAYVNQTATQGALGGRLFTFVDSGEDVFGETTQVGINIMPDGTLKAFRANAAGTGIVLRGPDQGMDSQVTLLGTSSATVGDSFFIEVRIVHHSTTGSITVLVDNETFWMLENVNTAISGRNQSVSYCIGGFASINTTFTTRSHEDLAAVISDIHLVNTVVNPTDANDPVTFFGDHKWLPSTATADGTLTAWTPSPVQAHYLNINEDPPDSADTNNSTDTLTAKDDFAMTDVAGTGTTEAVIAYRAFLSTDAPAQCGVTGDPANFEAFIYMVQNTPGEVQNTPPSGPPCNLSDFVTRRAQTVCTISQNSEKVTFKPLTVVSQADAYFVGLSPLDAPPRLQTPLAPGYFAAAGFHPKIPVTTGFTLADNINTTAIPGSVTYDLDFRQPWRGLAADTQDEIRLPADFFAFQLSEMGIGADVGVCDSGVISAPFNPYTSELIAFHFREDIEGVPYYWIGSSFGYANETIHLITGNPTFKIVRNDPNIELYEDATLRATFTPGAMPTILNPFVFLGRWGFVSPFGYIRRPGITNAVVQVGSNDCCPASFDYPMLSGAFAADAPELQQWGVRFNDGFVDAHIFDPGSTHGPFPAFGYDADTRLEFSLESGNVVLRIYDWVGFLDDIPDVGGVGTWTYTIPYANTDDFALQTPIDVGPPDFPNDTLEYDFVEPGANAPLRLVIICGADNAGDPQGITDVSFTFASGNEAGGGYAGVMRQSGTNKTGTVAEAPTSFRFKQSFLGTTPTGEAVTIDGYNEASHGYDRQE